jgi:hypothetical protein
MPTKTGFDCGRDFRRRFRFDAEWALALVRRPGLALRRCLAEEIAALRATGDDLAGRPAPALAPATGRAAKKGTGVFRKISASIAETSVFGDSGGVPSALALEDEPTVADGAAAAVFGAGRLFWRAGLLLRPLFRFVLARSAPILKLAAVGLAILAAAGFFAQWRHSGTEAERVQSPEAAKPAPRRLGWVKIPQPFHLYNLPAPLVAGEKLDYEARRHSTGGGREDFLSYGDFDGKAPFVRLAVTRHGSERMEAASFYVDMARRAAAIGISIDRADPPAPQATRFGEFETAAMSMLKGRLARDNCRGFRSSFAPPVVAIAGFACGADGQPLSARELACVINRLDLVSAREDKPLRDLFAAAAARGGAGCAEPGSSRRGRE